MIVENIGYFFFMIVKNLLQKYFTPITFIAIIIKFRKTFLETFNLFVAKLLKQQLIIIKFRKTCSTPPYLKFLIIELPDFPSLFLTPTCPITFFLWKLSPLPFDGFGDFDPQKEELFG